MSTSNNKKIGSLEIGAPREMRLSSHRCPFKTEILDQQRNFEIDCNKQKNQTTTTKKKKRMPQLRARFMVLQTQCTNKTLDGKCTMNRNTRSIKYYYAMHTTTAHIQ